MEKWRIQGVPCVPHNPPFYRFVHMCPWPRALMQLKPSWAVEPPFQNLRSAIVERTESQLKKECFDNHSIQGKEHKGL